MISSSGSYKTSDLVASIKDLGVDCFDIASAAESQRLLGRGAFGTAWLMRMRHTGKLVVAKEVRVDGLSARQGAQIVREVRNLSSLQHPYICDFIGVYARGGAEGATLGLLLKYAAGGTLEEFIADLRKPSTSTSGTSTSTPAGSSGAPGPTLPPGPARIDSERIARWVSQLATGLAFMHSCGVLHRDIATKNIFLATSSERSKVMLGDLGLSKETKPGDSMGHSAGVASTLCGTPKYFSPELLSNSMYGQPVCGEDAQTLVWQISSATHVLAPHAPCRVQADVWALGVVIFELLTLRAPFVAQNMMQLIAKIAAGPDEQAKQAAANSGHPPALCRLASSEGMLHTDPDKRLTLSELLELFPLVHGASPAPTSGSRSESGASVSGASLSASASPALTSSSLGQSFDAKSSTSASLQSWGAHVRM